VPKSSFFLEGFLRSAVGTTVATYQPREVIFSQGDASDSVIYLQAGAVKLSVLSHDGKEAVVAMLEPGAFFGESALVGRPVRREAATTVTATTVLIVPRQQIIRLLHEQKEFADRFLAHALARNIRIKEDVVDQLFNSIEKRLARALLLLARHGKRGTTHRVPPISQQTLADMVGTTRPRVNFFMNKFKKLGYIKYSGGLEVNDSLMTALRGEREELRASKAG
jgi:CRP/FNR family transcriptional regulator, cyclic AMP receptor protein